MSEMGQKQTSRVVEGMSALPLKADIDRACRHARFVPKADIETDQLNVGCTPKAEIGRWRFRYLLPIAVEALDAQALCRVTT
jgi:hypothetical protein